MYKTRREKKRGNVINQQENMYSISKYKNQNNSNENSVLLTSIQAVKYTAVFLLLSLYVHIQSDCGRIEEN